MRRIQIIMLLMSILLYFAPAMAQDITIPKPKLKTQTQTAPAKKSNSGTTSKSNNKSSTTGNSSQPSASNRSESKTTTQPSYIYPAEPEKTKPTSGYINGHEWVDLGLSVKWATCNVGASLPSDYGNYYAWGETRSKSTYTEKNSITYKKNMGSIAGNSTYDTARANWGGTWRLPTKKEIDELVSKCKHEWTTQGGHKGYKVTGPNGNSIFLPAAGWRNGPSLYYAGENGGYWGATPVEVNTYCAYGLDVYRGNFDRYWCSRYYGQSVRPVSE